ncbi:ABC transporter ATP-binding protein [Acinetobacter chinensis]|uniref:ABC transporter ATP-binding protein n=1 Tax=Acinetobacter chinensis TaxID=2004650 RepID=A0ABU3WBI5_9GAMM|nr:ABC transporter ATP-binding protein [Acinetobacter chinensis]MDV2467423.1 ABC transporter ATP-binding protein [Acinetobacter chinensis]
MNLNAEAEAKKQPGPISQILSPIRAKLILASVLAGLGTMLTLVPLAGIAHIASITFGMQGGSISSALAMSQHEIWQTVIISIVSLFIGLAIVTIGELITHLADNHITHHLRIAATKRLSLVPIGWFTSRASGEVKQAMQDDIGTLHELTAHFFTTLGRSIGAILISVIYLFVMDWRLAIVAIIPFPIFFMVLGSAMKASETHMGEFVGGLTKINNAVVEFVNGIPVIKAFGASGKAHKSYSDAVKSFVESFLNFTRPLTGSMANANAIVSPVAVLGIVLIFGTLFVKLGWMTAVDVLPFALVAPGISVPLLLLGFITHGLRNATGSAERVQALLNTPVLEQVNQVAKYRFSSNPEFKVENMSYGYNDQTQVLSNINLDLKPGTVTAVVGSSGAGKSTLARLLLRFFDPTEGRITLDGVDLRQIPTIDLYKNIGFVLQEVRLIHASVRDNIALGRPNATQKEIEDAARAANVHERILELPRGYDSVIGEDAQLSGGEQQRVSIARAVLLDPPILVLDEATAAADAENEVAIQEALSKFAKGRTLLVIAHRLDTIMHSDNIVVVENGSIEEQGTHQQLLDKNSRYANLWRLGGYAAMSEQQEELLQC